MPTALGDCGLGVEIAGEWCSSDLYRYMYYKAFSGSGRALPGAVVSRMSASIRLSQSRRFGNITEKFMNFELCVVLGG